MSKADFLAAAIEWVKAGSRTVRIDIGGMFDNGEEPEVKAWFYDYTLAAGEYLKPGDPLPESKDLSMKKAKLLELELETLKSSKVRALEEELDNIKTMMEAANA